MNIETLLVTGDPFMIDRHRFLLQELSQHIPSVQTLSVESIYTSRTLKKIVKAVRKNLPFLPVPTAGKFRKNQATFIAQSEKNEQAIRQLEIVPDLILHLYGMYSPLWHQFDIPYVTYLDYTTALAARNWQPSAPFATQTALNEWLDCERKAYENAHHLFVMSRCVQASLIHDYQIHPEKITVIHASGNFLTPDQGKKEFGSRQILFNGYDFERKGGDILLEAFKQVKRTLPDATLVIVGENVPIREQGVYNPGYVSSASQMADFFSKTDLVVSPARCEPLGFFLIEAMNYGAPCIVSNQDGMPDLIEHNYNGIVITQPDPERLANQIIELLTDTNRLSRMSDNARLKVQSQLTWRTIAQKMVATIERLEVHSLDELMTR